MKNILAGTQRLLARHTAKKEPITAFSLEQLVACKADSMTSLYNFRSVVICLLAFAAFRRFDELPKLVRSDVKIENDMWGSSLLPQMLACQTDFLSVMAAGLVKWLRTGMCKILYLHDVCRFLRL